jgi:four helix bundle suffix protein
MNTPNLIPNRSDYKELICYQKAEAIFDLTNLFTERYLKKGDRTIDQMVQAARSGKQNIVEGYTAGATSAETELKLFNVAKASSHELLIDYEDYLRVRGLRQWEKGSKEFTAAQRLGREHNDTAYWMALAATRGDETIANLVIVLIRQNDYLLYKYLQAVSQRFVEEGGFREKLTRVRLEERRKQQGKDDKKGH